MEIETERTPQHGGAPVDVLRAGLGQFVPLIADIIDQSGLGELTGVEAGDLGAGGASTTSARSAAECWRSPARQRGHAAQALHIEEAVVPFQFAVLFIHDAKRELAPGRPVRQTARKVMVLPAPDGARNRRRWRLAVSPVLNALAKRSGFFPLSGKLISNPCVYTFMKAVFLLLVVCAVVGFADSDWRSEARSAQREAERQARIARMEARTVAREAQREARLEAREAVREARRAAREWRYRTY